MKDEVIIVALICITILEACALFIGVNGAIFSGVIAALAGLGGFGTGYSIHAKKVKSNNLKVK